MDSKAKFTKQCDADFLDHNWGINPGESYRENHIIASGQV